MNFNFPEDKQYYNLSKIRKIMLKIVAVFGGLFIGFVSGSIIFLFWR